MLPPTQGVTITEGNRGVIGVKLGRLCITGGNRGVIGVKLGRLCNVHKRGEQLIGVKLGRLRICNRGVQIIGVKRWRFCVKGITGVQKEKSTGVGIAGMY